ncbi:MAG: hypothetical protein ACOCQD_04510, partial [archaeon]
MDIRWRFPPLSGGNEQGYTDESIEAFKGRDLIDNFTREVCQNSLDAKSGKHEGPVVVEFDLINLIKKDFKLFDEFKTVLKECDDFWGNRKDDKLEAFLEGANNELRKRKIPTMIVRDYNTTGLTGVTAARTEKSTWRALAHSDGTSVKEQGSGGSYGVGKNAPFACSSLSMVFYNTVAEDGSEAFQGVSRVATILHKGEPTQRVGHYLVVNENGSTSPIMSHHNNKFRDQFNRNDYGTDIIIPGFNETGDWEKEIMKAVLKHFFMAVHEDKLKVRIGDQDLTSDNLKEIFNDYQLRFNKNDNDLLISWQMFCSVLDENHQYRQKSILETNDISMYLLEREDYKKYIGYFRQTGMMVGKRLKRVFKRFSAVVIVRGKKLSELLRKTEPAKHTKWDYKIIPAHKKEERDHAKKVLEEIDNWVQEVLTDVDKNSYHDEIDSGAEDYLPDELEDESLKNENLKQKTPFKFNQTITKDISKITPNWKAKDGTGAKGDISGEDTSGSEDSEGGRGSRGNNPGNQTSKTLPKGNENEGKYRLIDPKVRY